MHKKSSFVFLLTLAICFSAIAAEVIPDLDGGSARIVVFSGRTLDNPYVYVDGEKICAFSRVSNFVTIDVAPGPHVVKIRNRFSSEASGADHIGDIGVDLDSGECIYLSESSLGNNVYTIMKLVNSEEAISAIKGKKAIYYSKDRK
jgi:hypothetical protein